MVGLWCCCGGGPITPPPALYVARSLFFNSHVSNTDGEVLSTFGFENAFAHAGPPPNSPSLPSPLASIAIGAKLVIYDFPEIEPEPLTPFTAIYKRYYGTVLTQRTNIPAGATIVSAILRADKNTALPAGPSIDAFIRVCLGTTDLTAAHSYPWNSDLAWDSGPTQTGGFGYRPKIPVSFSGDFSHDITAEVQAIVDQPTWGTDDAHRYVTLIVYTKYQQPALWVNNIHPSFAFPSKPATNTAIWSSQLEGATTEDQTNAIIDITWTA